MFCRVNTAELSKLIKDHRGLQTGNLVSPSPGRLDHLLFLAMTGCLLKIKQEEAGH